MVEFNDLLVTLGVIGGALTGIVLLGNAWGTVRNIISSFKKPVEDVQKKSEEEDEKIREYIDSIIKEIKEDVEKALEEHESFKKFFQNDRSELTLLRNFVVQLGESSQHQNEGIYLIIQHLISGGGHEEAMRKWMKDEVGRAATLLNWIRDNERK